VTDILIFAKLFWKGKISFFMFCIGIAYVQAYKVIVLL